MFKPIANRHEILAWREERREREREREGEGREEGDNQYMYNTVM